MFRREILRRVGYCISSCFILALFAAEASAQARVYARVEPNTDDAQEKLIFDVNVDATDNIAPNIVFSADSKRGFVAYAGSATIVVFSVENGALLKRVRTPEGKPFFATRLSDNQTLLFVSVLDNKIFVFDTTTESLVNTYTFPNAQFGFGSLITVSHDGTTGYVSSTATGEVIKFNVADGSELGRLKGMESPTQITLTPDDATLLVVDASASKEEVVFADTTSLTRKTALKGPTDRAMNFTIFNKPVLGPDGTTGIIASRDVNGILGADTVLLFRTDTGELVDNASIGAEPGFTTLTPDGKYWAVFNEFTLSLISTEDFKQIRSLDVVEGEPLGSANVVFTPDMKYAYYVSSAQDLVFQHDLVTGAVIGQVRIGDNPNVFLDQPATVALTPDGKSLAVLDFISNNIDLLTSATVNNATKFVSSAEQFTGLTLINLASTTNRATVYALNNFGELITKEGITNPANFELAPNQQITQTVAQIFHFDDTEERIGWISVYSDWPDIVGYLSIGDTSLTRLDAVPLFRGRSFEWIIPEVVRQEGKTVELNFVNPNFNQGATYDLKRFASDGTESASRTGNQAFPTNRQPQFFAEQFPEPAEVTDGYLRVTSTMGLLFTEFFGSANSTAALNGIDLSRYAGIHTLYSPQFALIPGFKTNLNIINANEEETELTITLHGPDGAVIGQPLKRNLVKGAQLKTDLATLFQDHPSAANTTGWIEVATTRDRVVGTVTFTNNEDTFLTSFELSGTALSNFLFPVLAQDDEYQTGVALLNANAEPANVTLEIWGPGGTRDRSTTVSLAPGQRTALYLKSFFPDLEPRLNGNIRVHSDQPLYGFSLINDQGFTYMTAIPPIPFP